VETNALYLGDNIVMCHCTSINAIYKALT